MPNLGHAFDCYVELLHNGSLVARAFGEAKNYELLSSHLDTFKQWLDDINFRPSTLDGTPPDLAFMIAPSCPPLLQRKLELRNIRFIPAIKNSPPPKKIIDTVAATDINTASKIELITAFKGTGIKQVTINKLISGRPYFAIDDMASDLKLTPAVQTKLKDKLDKHKICFL